MKKIIISFLSIAVLVTAFYGTALSQQKAKAEKDDDDNRSWNGRTPGTWDAVLKDGMVNIQFYGRNWSNERDFNAVGFGALPTEKISEFSLTRESGKMIFKGVFQDHWGHGTYKFEENAAFKSYLEQKGYSGLDDEL